MVAEIAFMYPFMGFMYPVFPITGENPQQTGEGLLDKNVRKSFFQKWKKVPGFHHL